MPRHSLPRFCAVVGFIPLLAAPVSAQEADGWSGEGAFSAGFTTGNTETRDAGVAVRGQHQGERWTQAFDLAADYGDSEGLKSKNRYAAAGQVDLRYSDAWSGYTRLSGEYDQFSGFANRYFAGVGVAFKALDGPDTTWTLQGGPGYKIDNIRATATAPASTEESVGGRLGSQFDHKFNERVSLSNKTEVVASEVSTQVSNGLALTANLMGNLNGRVSFDVRHDTDPLPSFEATDTATKFSLVYKLD